MKLLFLGTRVQNILNVTTGLSVAGMLGTDIAVTRWDHSVDVTQTYLVTRAANDPSVLTITEKASTRAFSWLKAPTSA